MKVDTEHFSKELLSIQRRWKTLAERIASTPEQTSDLVLECLEEMGAALEELHVVEEELLTQNEAILEANEALAGQLRRYQDLFEFAPDGYLETDMVGKIREANQAAVTLFNLPTDRLHGLPLPNLIAPDHRQGVRQQINHMATRQRVQHWEVECVRHREQPFTALLTVQTIYDPQGQPEALRWLVQDVTDMKRSQIELQRVKLQNMELAEQDRLKEQFLAHVSHELRSPLNSIIGFSTLLQQKFAPNVEEPANGGKDSATKMATCINRSGKNLLLLIEELLDFSQLKAGNLGLQPDSFDLCPLVQETLEDLSYLADQKSLKLQAMLPEKLAVYQDATRLRQILVNLVNNAIKFTHQGGVTVTLAAVEPDRLQLRVQDTGIGIAPADQEHIFKEFWQVRQSEHTRVSGTGLGLAIVQSLVRNMGGTIALKSQPRLGRFGIVWRGRSITSANLPWMPSTVGAAGFSVGSPVPRWWGGAGHRCP
jgi:PAS domain S-box-containing protein